MSHLVYIHGFLSSPASLKAVQVRDWLLNHRPDITYHCPALTAYPGQTKHSLERLVESLLPEPVYLMGSSLGGYWATWLVEKYGLRAVLINPLVKPELLGSEYLNIELKNYHSEDSYTLTEVDAEILLAANVSEIKLAENYWLMVQTGDETLDYRLAIDKYSTSRQLVEEGGDHSFQGFERRIGEAIDFLLKG
ncbi:MAG: esterase YqiA [Gammaproteobacteria bacterium]|nr:esterase YqiA [Gammaproteobacteria bacterium]